jgi:aminocarboxymuconate-semialdehyde decarboxylase
MNIDIHAHFIPRSCLVLIKNEDRPFIPFLAVDENGKEVIIMGGSRTPAASISDPETRIRDMSAAGIDFQILSSSPGLLFYDLNFDDALWFSRLQNEGFSKIVKDHPSRFGGLAAIPLQDPSKALLELDRAINNLGLCGVEILSHVNEIQFDDPRFLPFFKEVEALDVPVFIHPQFAGGERTRKYHLANLVGHPGSTALAAAYLIFGGVVEKCPGIKICLAHGGGSMPYIAGRWEHGYNVRNDSKEVIHRPPSGYLSNFYFDSITHSSLALEYLVNWAGVDKVMLGTDSPYDMGEYKPVSKLDSLKHLSEEEKQKILGTNASRLFKL